jgi:hypothetical protein
MAMNVQQILAMQQELVHTLPELEVLVLVTVIHVQEILVPLLEFAIIPH